MNTVNPIAYGGDSLEEWDKELHVYGVTEIIEELTKSKIFSCEECGYPILVVKDKPIPNFCSGCGKKIEWGSKLKDKYDVCPKCNKKFPQDRYEYCDIDGNSLNRI
ncbi:MAG: hypothetical protein ACW9W4_01220 [Candidatus Nitrosopumilus sp. bin_7KS]